MLTIYNSLTRSKQQFVPIKPGEVGMYVCGMTVYDFCHLGHARVLVVFDIVRRWLASRGYKVTYVRNITDIDDKIINRANENGEPVERLTTRFIDAMNEDAQALGVAKPDFEPRATATIPQMVSLIATLVDKGLAYRADNGDVYYSVRKFKDYGKLSGKSLEQLRAGERVDIDQNKRDALDFVLWKAAKPGEPTWDSPWGKGRPGWHIECFRTTRTRLPSLKAPMATRLSITGCTTVLSASTVKRCRNRSATSSPCARYWRSTIRRWCAFSSCVHTTAVR
jgi:cysteinyl-tRNA synthetase